MRLAAFTALSLGVVFSWSSFAVTVEPVEGQVTINRGDGIFRPVTEALSADIGDSVMVRPGGSARLVYPDGCVIEVKPGDVVTITALSPCKAPPDSIRTQSSDITDTQFALGATIAIGAGVAAAILLLNKNDDKPASP